MFKSWTFIISDNIIPFHDVFDAVLVLRTWEWVLNPNRFLIDEKRPERPLLLLPPPPPLFPMSLAGLMLKVGVGEGTAEGRFLICGGGK